MGTVFISYDLVGKDAMKNRRICRQLIGAIAVVACMALPLQAFALSIGEERKIGNQLMYSVRKELAILDDPDISQYIDSLGRKVLSYIGPQYFAYRFFVVKNDAVQRFCRSRRPRLFLLRPD